ncbi:hypothetical protein L3N51_02358 [Metallosphaera sp. J1]|uniref:AAA family ATPase n=1 Tax=Metallosphaera javensis (ex Hofmann et al. 2022) TaxID=99938 RepID=UPI001EDE188D|nr:AAA family ATPase [Metallosphaera javensis (ex Hofmann et al. 2022)]MCG3110061.1 hypothetical protein [Metallosphaera javensis (ex Hofmann et al. 2022)]
MGIEQFRWFPRWTQLISLTPLSLNFVYDSRQVGKTTGIKILIRTLLDRNVDPESVIYLDLDYVVSLQEFRRILEDILGRKSDTLYIFLDEVSSVEE